MPVSIASGGFGLVAMSGEAAEGRKEGEDGERRQEEQFGAHQAVRPVNLWRDPGDPVVEWY